MVASPDDPDAKIANGYLLIYDKKPTSDIEAVYAQAALCAMNRWKALPLVSLRAKLPLLNTFQSVVELKESARIARDALGPQRNSTVQEVKQRLQMWRARLPNTWEDVRSWWDLIAWRQFVYSLVNTAYQPFESSNMSVVAHTGHHETAWSINKLAHVARKHGLVQSCLKLLSLIYSLPNIQVTDAFAKLREQAKCYFQVHLLRRACRISTFLLIS